MKTTVKNIKTGLWMGLLITTEKGRQSVSIEEVTGGIEAAQKGVVIKLDRHQFSRMMNIIRARANKYQITEIKIDNAEG